MKLHTREKEWWKNLTFEDATLALLFPGAFYDDFKSDSEYLAALKYNRRKYAQDEEPFNHIDSIIKRLERELAGIWCAKCYYFQNGACVQSDVEGTYRFSKVNGTVKYCFVFAERESETRCRDLLKETKDE